MFWRLLRLRKGRSKVRLLKPQEVPEIYQNLKSSQPRLYKAVEGRRGEEGRAEGRRGGQGRRESDQPSYLWPSRDAKGFSSVSHCHAGAGFGCR